MEDKPINSFFLFCKEYRSSLLTKHPNIPNSEISAMLGKIWHNMNYEEQEPFITKADELRKKYNACNPNYVEKRSESEKYQSTFKLASSVNSNETNKHSSLLDSQNSSNFKSPSFPNEMVSVISPQYHDNNYNQKHQANYVHIIDNNQQRLYYKPIPLQGYTPYTTQFAPACAPLSSVEELMLNTKYSGQ